MGGVTYSANREGTCAGCSDNRWKIHFNLFLRIGLADPFSKNWGTLLDVNRAGVSFRVRCDVAVRRWDGYTRDAMLARNMRRIVKSWELCTPARFTHK